MLMVLTHIPMRVYVFCVGVYLAEALLHMYIVNLQTAADSNGPDLLIFLGNSLDV